MPSETARRRASYADLMAVRDNLIAEIVDGSLETSPRPTLRHAQTGSMLLQDLGAAFQVGRGGPGGWWILYEPELHLGEDVLVPDLAGWRRERLATIPDAPYATLAPDWICEILSPSTAGLDRVRKLRIYAREKVNHAWLVDPAARTLEVFRRQEEHWLLVATHAGSERVRAEPFDAVEIDLGDLWLPSAGEAP